MSTKITPKIKSADKNNNKKHVVLVAFVNRMMNNFIPRSKHNNINEKKFYNAPLQ